MKQRPCSFCSRGITAIDYKRAEHLKRFMTAFGKIETRRKTGACATHQRQLAQAIKRARHLALLPFVIQ